MGNLLRNPAASVVVFIAPAFLAVMPTATLAQQQGRPEYVPPNMERLEGENARQREVRQRETLRESLGKRPVRAANLRYVKAVLAQVNQDFERIQIARNQIVRAASTGKALDYKFISEVAGEIKKRAGRLEGNLALPEPEQDEKSQNEKSQKNGSELNEEQVKAALLTLCNRIESFVKSPIFETPGVIDVEHSANASRDLESMLQLSGDIKRSAERLNKAVAQP